MNKFSNRKIIKRLIIVLIFLMLFNFCYPNVSKAKGDIGERIMVSAVDVLWFLPKGALFIMENIFSGTSWDDFSQATNPVLNLTPENIIKQNFELMNPDIFTKATSLGSADKSASSLVTDKNSLRDTISGWYYALRDLSIVALLSVLVYVAIRMIISSASADKAKYKKMFKDWLVALCLLFIMHYIMYGTIQISNKITALISSGTGSVSYTQQLTKNINDLQKSSNDAIDGVTSESDDELIHNNCVKAMGYVIVYWAVVILTIIFTIKYIIRALLLIFLTLLAPISCITYPIDKIGDGKSQAFNTWLREYIMQIMIQPFHLLLYTVLIGSAAELAEDNIIYGILCFAIMIPAEKFVKQMFGINEKLGSPLGAMASGAAISKLANSMKKSDRTNNKKDTKIEEPEMPPKQKPSITSYDNGEDNGDLGNTNETNEQDGVSRANDNSLYGGNNGGDVQQGILPEEKQTYGENEGNYQDEIPEESSSQEELPEDVGIYAQSQGRYSSELEQARNATRNEIGKDVRKALGYVPNKPHPVKKLKDGWAGLNNYYNSDKDTRRNMRHIAGAKLGHMSYRGAKLIAPAAGKVLSGAVRGTLGAGIGAMAGIGTLAATGSFSKAVAATSAGAAIGNVAGKKINGVRAGVNQKIGKYIDSAYNTTDGARQYAAKKKKQEYIQNQSERDYVAKLLKDKNSGRIPSGSDIDAEMNRRYEFVDAGITDKSLIDGGINLEEQKKMEYINNNNTNEQIEAYNNVEEWLDGSAQIEYKDDNGDTKQRAVNEQEVVEYKKSYTQLNNGNIDSVEFDEKFGNGAAEKAKEHYRIEEETSKQQSKFATEAKFAASLANDYKAKDFRDEKTMKNAKESYVKEFKNAVGNKHSDKYVNNRVEKALNDAAHLQGVKGGANFGKK